MSDDFKLNATNRTDKGKGASRRLRRLAGQVPGIIYGAGEDPTSISLAHNELIHSLENEAFYSRIITIDVEGDEQDAIVKDVQRHPAKAQILHIDFMRIKRGQALQTKVPLHFINQDTCVGVKMGGGIPSHNRTEIEISCLPRNLPEYIEVDVIATEVGQTLHISDIVMPEGVTSVDLSHDHDLAIFTVNAPKRAEETEESADAAEGDAAEGDSQE